MPTLPKHLRPRWRYLAVGIETWPDADFDRGAFQRHLWFAAQNLLGDAGSARIDLSVLQFAFDAPTGEAVVRARRGHVEPARAVLACLAAVDGHPVGVNVRGVSGTVRACEEKYLGRRREPPGERTVVFGTTERSALVREDRVDVRTDGVPAQEVRGNAPERRSGGAFTGATHLDLE